MILSVRILLIYFFNLENSMSEARLAPRVSMRGCGPLQYLSLTFSSTLVNTKSYKIHF